VFGLTLFLTGAIPELHRIDPPDLASLAGDWKDDWLPSMAALNHVMCETLPATLGRSMEFLPRLAVREARVRWIKLASGRVLIRSDAALAVLVLLAL